MLALLLLALVLMPAPLAAAEGQAWRKLYRRPGQASGTTVDLRIAGDVMLGRYVARIAERRGYGYPLAATRELLAGDLAIGNLESPLTGRKARRSGPYRLPAPPAFAAALREAGFGVLSLANNHALDAGPEGLRDAVTALQGAGMAPLGAGPTAAAAREPAIVIRAGLRIALLAFNDVADPEDTPDEGRGWGRAWLNDDALEAVRRARKQADLVVLLVHWGQEYAPEPTARQRDWGRRLVAAGAALVVGAHPHVVQPVEVVAAGGRQGVVAYSLGNFVFDNPPGGPTSRGVVLRARLDTSGVRQLDAAPVAILAGQPRPLATDDPEFENALPPAILRSPSSLRRSASAWRWDGRTAKAVAAPPDLRATEPATRLAVDLRGDGKPLWASLDTGGTVVVRDGPGAHAPIVWRGEPGWRVTRIAAGDPNRDGRVELLLLLWKPGPDRQLRTHPFLIGWRGEKYRVVWGGSATATPIQDAAIGDLDGDGWDDLAVLEGGDVPGDPAQHVAILRWFGWGFQREWLSPPGRWSRLSLQDVDGYGGPEVVAMPGDG